MQNSALNRLFYFGIIPGLFIQFIGAFFYFVIFPDKEYAQILYFLTKVLIVVWPLLWLISGKKYFASQEKATYKKSILVGIGSGILFVQIIFFVFLGFKDYFSSFAPLLVEKAQSLNIINHYILFSIFLSIFHSLLEEYYWRWFIFKGLLIKFPLNKAAAIGSLGFATHHYIILSQFFPAWLTLMLGTCVGISGFLWCLFYAKTGRIITSWTSHLLVDAILMTIGYILIIF